MVKAGMRAGFARGRFATLLTTLGVALSAALLLPGLAAAAATTTIPTSGVESYNPNSPYAGLVISSFDPDEGNAGGSNSSYLSQTWVQLFNSGSQPVNLNGLSVQDFGGGSLTTDEWGAAGSANGGPIELGANANSNQGFSTPVGGTCTTSSGPADQTGCLQPGQYYLLGSAWDNATEGGDATSDLPATPDQVFTQEWKPGNTTAPAPYLSTSAYAMLVDGTNDLQQLSSTMSWPENGDAGIIDAIATATNYTAGTTPVWGGNTSNGAAPDAVGRAGGDQMLERQHGGCVNTGDNSTDWAVTTVKFDLPTTLEGVLNNSTATPSPCPDAATQAVITSVPKTVAPGAQFTVKVAGEDAGGNVVAGDGVPDEIENTGGAMIATTNPLPTTASTVTLSDSGDDGALTCVDGNAATPGLPLQDATASMYHGYATFTCTVNPQSGDPSTVDLKATETAVAEGGFSSPTVKAGTATVNVSADAPQPQNGSWEGLIIDSVSGDGSNGSSGGFTGYKYDYVDLFDSGAEPVSLQGLSLQLCIESAQRTSTNNRLATLFGWPQTKAANQQAAGGCTNADTQNSVLALPDVILQPGQHFLVAGGGGNAYTNALSTNYSDLPTIPDEDWAMEPNNWNLQVLLVDGTSVDSDNTAGTLVSPADTADAVSASNDYTGLAEPVIDSFTTGGLNSAITEPGYDPGVTWIEGEIGPYVRNDQSAARLDNGCLNTQDNGYDYNSVPTLSVPAAELQDMSGTVDQCAAPAKLAFSIQPPSTSVPTSDMQNAFTVQVVSEASGGDESFGDNDTTGTLSLEQDSGGDMGGDFGTTSAKLSCVQVSQSAGDYLTGQTSAPPTTSATDSVTGITTFQMVGGTATLDCSVDTDGQGYALTASGSSAMYGPLLQATTSQFAVADPTAANWSSSSTTGLVVSESFMGGGYYDATAGHEGDNGYWPYSFIELQNDGTEPVSLGGLSVQQFGYSASSGGHDTVQDPTPASLTGTIPNDLNVNDSENNGGLPEATDLRDVTLAPGQHYLITADVSQNDAPAGFYNGNVQEPIGDQNDIRYAAAGGGDPEEGEMVALVDGEVPMPRVDLQDPPVNPGTGVAQPIVDSLTDAGSANGYGIVVPGVTYSTGFAAQTQPSKSEGYGYTRAEQGCQDTENNVLDFSLTWSSNITPLGMNAAAVDCPQILAPSTVPAGLVIASADGAGGQNSSYYGNDFVELENSGSTPVSLIGKAVEWIGGDGFTSNATTGNVDENTEPLVPNATDNGCTTATAGSVEQTGCLQPGQFFLLAGGGIGGGDDQSISPEPDQSDPNFNINWPSTSENCYPNPDEVPAGESAGQVTTACDGGGLVLLTDTTQQLNASDLPSADVIDALGVGGPAWSEGSAVSTPTDLDAEFRDGNGCAQSDNNATDFTESNAQHGVLFNSNSTPSPCPPPGGPKIYAFGYTPSPSSVVNGAVTTLGEFANSAGIAIGGPSGTTYVADTLANEVLTLPFATSSALATPFAGQSEAHGNSGDDGAATSATLDKPSGIAVDSDGNVFIADTSNDTVREVPAADETQNGQSLTAGDIYTVAGNGTAGFKGDNGQATSAELNQPIGLAVYKPAGGDEMLYIADSLNDAIRAVDLNTGVITTVAGTPGSGGYGGDNGAAGSAELNTPEGLAVDSNGDLFIADSANNVIRELKVDPSSGMADGSSTISTVAGDYAAYAANGYVAIDAGNGGPATAAQLNDPQAIAVDPGGDLFIADTYDNAIREVDASTGDISLVTDSPPVDPEGVAVDPATGDLFVASTGDDTVTLVAGADVKTTPAAGPSPSGSLAISGAPNGAIQSGAQFTVTVSDGESGDNTTDVGLTLVPPPSVLAPTGGDPATLSCGAANTAELNGGSATFTCTVNGPGDGYRLEAAAVSPGGDQGVAYIAPTESAQFNIAYPVSQPGGIAAQSTNEGATINWTPVSGATGYDIYEATASGAELFTNPNDTITPGSRLLNAPVKTVSGADVSSATLGNLVDGQGYDFLVQSVSGAGNSKSSQEVSAMPVAVPSGVSAASEAGSATVSWAPSEGATGYTVLVSTAPGNEQSSVLNGCAASGAMATNCTVAGLSNNTQYYFVVEATNSSGTSGVSSEVTETPSTVPDAPAGVSGTAGDGQVTVSWTAANGEGAAITGYSVYAATTAGAENTSGTPACTTTSSDDNPESCVITGLTNGTPEYFLVLATNANGDSAPSTEASQTPSTTPGAPTNVTATAGADDVEVDWTTPADDGGSPITAFKVYDATTVGGESLVSGVACVVNSGAATSCTVTGLVPGVKYHFVVVAMNADGDSVFSNEVSATQAVDPDAPTGLTATTGSGQVALSWIAPASPTSPVTSYSVYDATSSAGENLSGTPVCSDVSGTSCTVKDLADGTSYYFVVVANLQNGNIAASGETSATPLAAPSGVTATGGNQRATVSWTADPGATGYEVLDSPTSGGENLTGATACTTIGTSCTVTGLTNGTAEYFVVIATVAGGSSTASAETSATPFTVPSAPGAVAVAPGNGQLAVTWTAPTDNGGSAITGYDVYVGTSTGAENLSGNSACSTSGATSCTVAGLQNGTTYYVVVVADNAAGGSTGSAEESATPSTLPDAPTGLTVTANGSSSANVSWSAPSDNGGSALTGYEVFSSTAKGGENLSGAPICSTATTQCAVTGLAAGTSYYFVVLTSNANGNSAASSEVGITTTTAASAVGDLTATGGNGTAQVSWLAPTGGPATTYSVYVSTTQPVATTGTPAYKGTGTSYTVTGLNNGTTYYIVVVTTGADGSTATSSTVSVVPTGPTTGTGTAPSTSTSTKKSVKTTPAHVSLSAGTGTTVTELAKQLKAGTKLTVKASAPGRAKPVVRSARVKGDHTYQYKTGKLPIGTTTIRFYAKSGKKLKQVWTEKVTVKATPAHESLPAGTKRTTVGEVDHTLKPGTKLTVKVTEPGRKSPITAGTRVQTDHDYDYTTGKLPIGTTTIEFYEAAGNKLISTEKVKVSAAHKKSRLANSISRKADVQ